MYYLPKNHVSSFDLSVNAQYVFPLNQQFEVYPLAGIGLYSARFSYAGISESNSEFVVNLGVGAAYKLTPSMSIGLEGKYMLIDSYNTPAISANVMFKL